MGKNTQKLYMFNGLGSIFRCNISKDTESKHTRKAKKARITQLRKDLKSYLKILATSNIKYVWWYKGDAINENGPFYYENKTPPSIEQMQNEGINCAGLINVLFRYMKKKLPSEGGGTEGWFQHFNRNVIGKNNLLPINLNKDYPTGTILLRDYHNEKDQGHLAIVYDGNKKLKDTQIIHAYSSSNMNRELTEPGIIIEDFSNSHQWFNGTYTHVVLPY